MIEYQTNTKKRLILKIISAILVVTFVWYDIAWAGDLYYYNLAHTAVSNPPLKEVTNYDLLSPDKRKSDMEDLLPTGQDKDQSNKFSPGYIQEQQGKHEEIIRQKQDSEDIIWNIDQNLERKLKTEEVAPELKKKRGGGEGKAQASTSLPIKYVLSDHNEKGEAQQINVYSHKDDGSLESMTSYNIRGLDQSKWIAKGKEMDGKDGQKFFGSTEEADMETLTSDHILEKVIYSGPAGSEKIDHVLSNYDASGKPWSISLYEYRKSADDKETLNETKTYNIEGSNLDTSGEKAEWIGSLNNDMLSKTTIYGGKAGEEKVSHVFDGYAKGDDNVNKPNSISIYDYNNNA
ncbi:MAG: hypothetical protein Q8O01_05880, partial [Candidatus Omnitrophota bacterium]|nr:hypothetical protein [Candidatus Omnitrophota bacterium]